MKTQTMIVIAVAAAGGVYLWQKQAAAAQQATVKTAVAAPASSIPVRKSTVVTAPVKAAKPVAVKSPSTASTLLSVGANAAAQYGCSYLSGYQKDLCLQGSGVVAGGLTSLKLW